MRIISKRRTMFSALFLAFAIFSTMILLSITGAKKVSADGVDVNVPLHVTYTPEGSCGTIGFCEGIETATDQNNYTAHIYLTAVGKNMTPSVYADRIMRIDGTRIDGINPSGCASASISGASSVTTGHNYFAKASNKITITINISNSSACSGKNVEIKFSSLQNYNSTGVYPNNNPAQWISWAISFSIPTMYTNNITLSAVVDNDTSRNSTGQRFQGYLYDGTTSAPRGSNGSGTVKATPGDKISWWFQAKNNDGNLSTFSSMDLCNYRGGFAWGGAWNNTPSAFPADPNAKTGHLMDSALGACTNGNGTDNYQSIGRLSPNGTSNWGVMNWGAANMGNSNYTTYTITQNDVGTTACQNARSSWNNGSWQWMTSPWACVNTPYQYSTNPQSYINDQQPTATCTDLSNKSNTQANCLPINSTSGKATAAANFWHNAVNSGPTKRWGATNISIVHNVDPGGTWGRAFSNNSWPVDSNDSDIKNGNDATFQSENTLNVNFANDAGKIWCSEFVVSPGSYNNGTSGGDATSTPRCAHVAYNYSVSVVGTGNVSTDTNGNQDCSGGSTQIGTAATLNYTISAKSGLVNGSTATKSLPVSWRVVDDSGNVLPTSQYSPASPAGGQVLMPGQEIKVVVNVSPQTTVGQIVNYHLQISDNGSWANSSNPILTQQDNQTNHSSGDGSCTIFAKLPQLNIRGADSFANGLASSGKSFAASASTQSMSGSFSQYAIMGNKTIDTFGSGGWNVNGDSANKSCIMALANVSGLASTCLNGNGLGNAGLARSVETPELSRFISQSDNPAFGVTPGAWQGGPIWNSSAYCSTPHVDLGHFQTPGTYAYTGNVQISGGGYAGAQPCTGMFGTRAETSKIHGNYIIYVKGDITIADNINLDQNNGDTSNNVGTTKFAKLTDIPQFTIYATGNIKINSNVSRIDANLISGGTITTCDSGYSSGAADLGENATCGNNLMINGAMVSSGSPKFQRTFGAELSGTGAPIQTPAETVNYTPSLFLAPFVNSGDVNGENIWSTINDIVVPPQY